MREETKKTWNEKEPILKIENMSIRFTQYDRGMHQTELPVIRNLDVEVRQGEMVAVVGSSGSGKSLLAHGVMGVLPYNAVMGGTITEKDRKTQGKRDCSCTPEYGISESADENRTADPEGRQGDSGQKQTAGNLSTV